MAPSPVALFLFCFAFLVALCSADTGDSTCTSLMCVSAVVNSTTAQYVLQRKGSQQLGWMAIGFGSQMAHTPMVIMWPNSDDSVTLSQRMAPEEEMPTVDSNPPRTAALAPDMINLNGTGEPTLSFTVPANSDTKQHLIWAFGTTKPDSSAVDATLVQHLDSGTITLDLTKSLNPSSTGSGGVPTPTSTSGSGDDDDDESSGPYLPFERLIIAHAVLTSLGFVVLLPLGALFARYVRTYSPTWFRGHWVFQFALALPVIVAGVGLAVKAVDESGSGHVNDTHKKAGIALFVLYFAQLFLGAIIHWVKPRTRTRRPAQNYLHAIVGVGIIALGFYMVYNGMHTEWPQQTGRGEAPKGARVFWYVWIAVVGVLYFGGMALLRRQYRQEAEANAMHVKNGSGRDGVNLVEQPPYDGPSMHQT